MTTAACAYVSAGHLGMTGEHQQVVCCDDHDTGEENTHTGSMTALNIAFA